MRRAVRFVAVLYLVLLLVLWGLMRFDTTGWWPLTLFLFSPRWVVAIPLIVILPVTLVVQPRLALFYILHCLIISVPIMDFRIAWNQQGEVKPGERLNVMTCNLGGGNISLNHLVALAETHQIHVLVLQECSGAMAESVFAKLDWHYQRVATNAIGSSYPLGELQVLARQPANQYRTIIAFSCNLRIPVPAAATNSGDAEKLATAEVSIVDVHFPTFRPAFEIARAFGKDTGHAIEEAGSEYSQIAENVLRQVNEDERPTVICGDFNVPFESTYYRNLWSDYQNALNRRGAGLRYTKHTRLHGVRIDHVLTDEHWSIHSAFVGTDVGGDHRPVIAELSLTQPTPDAR